MRQFTFGVPNEKQVLFLEDTHRHVAYGGARGGGKSWSVQEKSYYLALSFPGIKILIVRKTYPELLNNHVYEMKERLAGIATYNKSERLFTFFNGSTIKFGYCANDNDLDQYQGAQYDVVFLDEAGQLQEEWIKKINACVRGVNGFPKRTYYTLNPGGPSHGYFKRLFVDRHFEGKEKPEDYSFIQALVTDNKVLMEMQPEYKDELENLPPKLRKAWLYGDWDIFEGQFFEDFRLEPDTAAAEEQGCRDSKEKLRADHRWCHVIESIDLSVGEPRSWSIFRSYDFGYGKPFSCAWWALDYDGVMYRILELYGCTDTPNEGVKWTPDQQFAEIARIERTHPWLKGKKIDGVADPAIWDGSRGESIAETAMKHGLYFQPGDNDRIPGWMQCPYRLQFDERGFSRMYVFDNCKAFIRTVPLMMYDEHKVEDLDTKLEDHVSDEWRYACMSRPISPMRPVEKKQIFYDPLDQFKKRS